MSFLACCVPGCTSKITDDIPLHCFPNPEKDIERFRSWVMNVGGEMIALDNNFIFKNRRVCRKHFVEQWHYTKNRLCPIAVPTLYLRGSHQTLHLFPNPAKDIERFNQWVFSIGGDIIGLDNKDIYKNRSVCHFHFEEKFCCRFNRLSNIAVPTLNLPGYSTIPKFTFSERRPTLQRQNCPTNTTIVSSPIPSTSAYLSGQDNMILHIFPNPSNQSERFHTWLYAIGGDILALENQHIFKYRKVCHTHFETKYYTSSRRLSANAVPTLHLPGVPLQKFPHPVKDAERFSAWVTNTGGDISLMDVGDYFNKRVCRRHFETKFRYPLNRLCKLAVPSLHVPALQQTMVIEPVAQSSSSVDSCSGSNEQQESESELASQEKGDDKTKINKCVLCDKKGITPSSEEVVLSKFPLNPAICRTWVKKVGLKELLSIPIQELNKTLFLCQKHFNPGCFIKKDNLRILKDIATPCIDLYYPSLPEEMMSVFCTEDQTGSRRFPTGSKAENINLRNDDTQDYNDYDVEYLEEDLYDKADIFENIEINDDYDGSHNVKPTIETKLSIDEIDNLFASYSVTFRKFPSKLQTMLKIDLAKLFARYEMKNAALQCSSDEQQQAKDDTPSTILLEETKKAEKRIKRKPYITTNNPSESLTHSKSVMPNSQVFKDTEGAVNKSLSKKNKLLKNKAIIKNRVSDTKDNDNIVLQTNDQYQKPMKVRKLEEDNVDTSRSLSNSQDSQGTSALVLITDRSSKKLTTESDKISQSQESAS